MKRTLRTLTVVATAATVLTAAGSADASPPDWTTYQGQWVSGQNFLLNAVDVVGGDIWAVGYRYGTVGGALEFRTVVEHSTGGTFTMSPARDREGAPATNFLEDVSGAAPDEVWTVGWSRDPGQPSRTLIERWDGSSWNFATSPDPGQYGNILEGVDALSTDDVWAVGARQDTFYQSPLTEHWNGSTWQAVRAPNPSYCTGHSYLTDVTMQASDDVWAVGWCTASSRGGEQGYVLRWNGTRWSIAPGSDAAIPQNTELYGITPAGARGVWVVGWSRDTGAVALRRLGATWTVLDLQQPDANLAGVAAKGATTAWAVGAGLSPQPPFAGPGALRMNVTAAAGVPEPIPVDYGSLRGVTYDAGTGRLWAVGTQLPGQYNTPLIVSRTV